MIELIVPTDRQKLAIEMQLHFDAPCEVRAVGYDKSNPKTTFFNRLIIPSTNTFDVDFTLPISPRNLVIILNNESHGDNGMFRVSQIGVDELNNIGVDLTQRDYDNIKWLIEFAKDAKYKLNGIYNSPHRDIWINYMPIIIDDQEGALNTPARVDHATGEIQASSQKFEPLTVTNIAGVLVHEYSHWRWDSKDETFCDLEACRILLGLGFSKSEVIYTFSNTLSDTHQNNARMKQIYNYVKSHPNGRF